MNRNKGAILGTWRIDQMDDKLIEVLRRRYLMHFLVLLAFGAFALCGIILSADRTEADIWLH
jgi:uncharacterized membrane protein